MNEEPELFQTEQIPIKEHNSGCSRAGAGKEKVAVLKRGLISRGVIGAWQMEGTNKILWTCRALIFLRFFIFPLLPKGAGCVI